MGINISKERTKDMNTEKAVERIAANNSAGTIWEWWENISKRQLELHEAVLVLGKVCAKCPFRNNSEMGGCISTACPVQNAEVAVNKLSFKALDIAKKARTRRWSLESEQLRKVMEAL